MRMIVKLTAALSLIMVSVGCQSVAPDAGTEAVLIRKPLIFGSGGVDSTPVKTGRKFVALTTEVEYVDVRPFMKSESINDTMSSDGVPLDFEARISMRVLDSTKLIERFGTDWYRLNVQGEYLKAIRDAVKKRGMNEVAITAKASEEIDAEVTEAIRAFVKSRDIPVEVRDVTLGRANPPDAIKDQRVATAAQEQRQNTEKFKKLAEDQRREAEMARAAADNAYRQAMQLSPEQFLALERMKVQTHQIDTLKDVCAGGKCTVFVGASDVVPTLPVR